MSCDLTSAADHCQGAVDGGGIVDLNYGNGHVYAQHNNTGGAWINNLQAGQTFTMNGSTYRVNGQSVQGAQMSTPAIGCRLAMGMAIILSVSRR